MAQYAYEQMAGLKYTSGPQQIKEYTASATVYQNGLVVLLSTGLVTPWPGTGLALGVTLSYAAAGEKVLVNIDPESIYEATMGGISRPTITDIGKYVALTQENPALSIGGRYSSMKLGTPTTTVAVTTPVQIVGLSSITSDIPNSFNKKCFVKLTTGQLEPFVDAV